ncbi:hypothetical protein [Saccharomonospora halophila]|uniref:hypothetical protein n=1 Tax=Saccharomonospora halophila TaxID=129922 RepID=UPI0003731830|nr:hypothetical protein [Saccharomonospora halophila]
MAPPQTPPTPAEFAELARSAPRLWTTVRFTLVRRAGEPAPADRSTIPEWSPDRATDGVRARLRRPDALRVETRDGSPLQVTFTPGNAERDDELMFQDYHWVAMLNPVEFANGEHEDMGEGDPLQFDDLRAVQHHGRPAWQADVHPTGFYAPRCPCCPLLFSAESEDVDGDDSEWLLRNRYPELRYPEAHRVRLDVATGVCVSTEELGGSRPGRGHDVRIEAVDESMPDTLFTRTTRRRRGPWWRRRREGKA